MAALHVPAGVVIDSATEARLREVLTAIAWRQKPGFPGATAGTRESIGCEGIVPSIT
jgi:hypothetical protein